MTHACARSGRPGAARLTIPLLLLAAAIPLGTTACRAQNAAASPARAPIASFAPIARVVTPAVVSITSEFSAAAAQRLEARERGVPPGAVPPQLRQRGPAEATGSGFLISADGYILTNNHVVAGAEQVTVTLADRRIFPATVIGHDPSTDIALIKIDGTGFPTAPLGDDSTVQVGDQVLAIGNPLGLDFTVTSGIISAKGRSGSLRDLFPSQYAVVDFLQTDAVINPGNSGGPLIDMRGRVIGVNSAIASPTGVYAGYGFAVPVSIARQVEQEFLKYGKIRRGILGVSIQDVGPADAEAAGLHEIRGALIGGFAGANSPAERAGLKPGDIITSVDGHAIDRASELQRILFGYQPGQTISVTVMRYGTSHTLPLTLGEAPSEATVASANGDVTGGSEPASARLGITIAPITADVASQLQLPDGTSGVVVVQVDPNGPASQLLEPRDVIRAVLGADGRQAVATPGDLEQALAHPTNGVLSLYVYSPRLQQTRVVNVAVAR